MNSTSFVGNLVRDPVLRTSQNGKNRATFAVAVNEGERGTDSEKTHFVDVTAFGTLGENVADSLSKGQRVVIVGRLDTYGKEVEIDGETKNLTQVSFIASAVGPDLRWAHAKVTKVVSNGNGNDSSNDGKEDDNGEAEAEAKPAKSKKKETAPAASTDEDDDF